ncbi:MAG: hypothetical protein HFE63_06380 [Clostridiales bacterium]|nr:hypothetical protein [Clostridiales bacterium]
MTKMSKILTLFLAVALFTVSCGDNTKQPETTSDGATDSSSDTTVTVEVDPLEKLGEHDFGGANYVILSSNSGYGSQPAYDFELTVDEANGEVLNDAVYERQVKIEERYNVHIVKELMEGGQPTATIKRAVVAGDTEYSLVSDRLWDIITAATGDCFANYYDFEDIDLHSPWWNQDATNSLTINDKCYLQMNYINVACPLATHCLFYNKRIADEYNVSGIYDMVLDGTWTMDKLLEISENVTADLNGDTVYDDQDLYGFIGSLGCIGIMHYGCDNGFLNISDDGKVSHLLMTDRLQTTIEKVYKLCYEGNYSYARPVVYELMLPPMFANGHGLFYAGFFFDMLSTFRDMKDDYGLLPYPKFDENQDGYYTAVHGGAPLLGIPRVVEDSKMVGVITEALAIESYNNVRPALVDLTIRNKLLRDEQSSQIYDIFLDGIKVNVALIYRDNTNDVFECIVNMMTSKTTDLAAYVDSKMPAAVASYQRVIDHFYED